MVDHNTQEPLKEGSKKIGSIPFEICVSKRWFCHLILVLSIFIFVSNDNFPVQKTVDQPEKANHEDDNEDDDSNDEDNSGNGSLKVSPFFMYLFMY